MLTTIDAVSLGYPRARYADLTMSASSWIGALGALGLGCGPAVAAPAPCPAASPVVVAVSKPPPPVSDASALRISADPSLATCGRAVDLDWLDDAAWLRVASTSHGHFGHMELHVDLERYYGAEHFAGTMTVTYRAPYRAHVVDTKPLEVSRDAVRALLTVLRDGAFAPPEPNERNVYVSDASRSEMIFVDAIKRKTVAPGELRAPHHVQFVVDDAETTPARWRLRSCGDAFPYSAQKATTDAYARFLIGIGHAVFVDALEKKAATAPRKKR